MGTKIRVELNGDGIRAVLRSPAVLADLMRRGNQVASAAGPGHMVTSHVGRTRARVSVITATPSAMRREAVDRALTRALDAARR